jgi:alpha-tubulin suppressor-like RCC1 family protein
MACPNNLECASGTSCLGSCGSDANCTSGYWCSAGVCVPKGAAGASCSGTDQCASGFCVDGFCCNTACGTACQACSAALNGGANGTCGPVSGGVTDPRGLCATTAQTSCGTNGTCSAGACADYPSGTVCTNVCSAGSQTTAACNGTGTCVAGGQKACSPYVCGAGACKTSCVTHADCIAGDFCWNAACTKANAITSEGSASGMCALVAGGVQCWGYGGDGELGNSAFGNSNVPVPVSNLTGVTAVATGGDHSCAVAGGGVQCWGSNADGQLGNNSTMNSNVPIPVPGLSSGVTAVGAGDSHSCVVKGGGVLCWGRNTEGELGNNSQNNSLVPVQVSGLTSGVAAVVAGDYHTCALTTAGAVQCWGWNSYGQGGANPPYFLLTPQPVAGLSSGVIAIAAGSEHTCALTAAGAVKCWGRNQDGQLGNGTTTDTDASAPVQVTGLTSGVVAIGAGYGHTCAATSAGAVMCWGWDSSGEIGPNASTCTPTTNPPQCTTPIAVPGITGATAIAGGFELTCALTATGPQCWGSNNSGALGNGGTVNSATPVPVAEP